MTHDEELTNQEGESTTKAVFQTIEGVFNGQWVKGLDSAELPVSAWLPNQSTSSRSVGTPSAIIRFAIISRLVVVLDEERYSRRRVVWKIRDGIGGAYLDPKASAACCVNQPGSIHGAVNGVEDQAVLTAYCGPYRSRRPPSQLVEDLPHGRQLLHRWPGGSEVQDDAALVTMRHAKAPTRLRAIPEVGIGGNIIGCHSRDHDTAPLSRRRFLGTLLTTIAATTPGPSGFLEES